MTKNFRNIGIQTDECVIAEEGEFMEVEQGTEIDFLSFLNIAGNSSAQTKIFPLQKFFEGVLAKNLFDKTWKESCETINKASKKMKITRYRVEGEKRKFKPSNSLKRKREKDGKKPQQVDETLIEYDEPEERAIEEFRRKNSKNTITQSNLEDEIEVEDIEAKRKEESKWQRRERKRIRESNKMMKLIGRYDLIQPFPGEKKTVLKAKRERKEITLDMNKKSRLDCSIRLDSISPATSQSISSPYQNTFSNFRKHDESIKTQSLYTSTDEFQRPAVTFLDPLTGERKAINYSIF
eukprot:snap_masked-scaffold_40-processed-gene-2.13-mRNA-1 protein AED:1.00 eAED:1.00 QI:0/-1/0/0/-1/1/1/0/293